MMGFLDQKRFFMSLFEGFGPLGAPALISSEKTVFVQRKLDFWWPNKTHLSGIFVKF